VRRAQSPRSRRLTRSPFEAVFAVLSRLVDKTANTCVIEIAI
jgi:hypothetical protein